MLRGTLLDYQIEHSGRANCSKCGLRTNPIPISLHSQNGQADSAPRRIGFQNRSPSRPRTVSARLFAQFIQHFAELSMELSRKLVELAASGVTDAHELRRLALEAFPRKVA